MRLRLRFDHPVSVLLYFRRHLTEIKNHRLRYKYGMVVSAIE